MRLTFGRAGLGAPALMALALAMVTALAAPPQAAAQAPLPGEQGDDLAGAINRSVFLVRGNQRIEPATIIAFTQLEGDTDITADDLNAAVGRLFATGLFQDARIVPQDGRLVIEVVENPSINEIAFEGNDALNDQTLLGVTNLRPRRPFTPARVEQAAQRIIEVYRRSGRFAAEVEPVIIERDQNRVDVVFEIVEGEPAGVLSIDFIGNDVFSDRRLRNEIETTESGIFSQFISSDVYDPDRVQLDEERLRQFYLENGYADFEILSTTAELSPDGEGFFITFTIEEGPIYEFSGFDVDVRAEGLDPERLLDAIDQDLVGETYDATEVETIANRITERAGQAGFAFVNVRPRVEKDAEEQTIFITFEVQEGERIFIERIDIIGNTATLDRVIRREIDLIEGDAFDARRIRRAQSRIRGLGYFESVDIDAAEGSASDRAVLTVKVVERSTGSLSLGLGFSSSAGPIGSAALTERNFLGRGQQVAATVTAAGDTQVYDFSFTEPKVLDRDLSASARAFFIDDDRGDESSIRQVRGGFRPSVAFPLGERTRLSLTYSVRFDDLDISDSASPAIQSEEGSKLTSLIGYDISYDERNDPVEPTGGFVVSFGQDIAGLGGDQRFVSTRGRAKGWKSFFGQDLVFSLEVEGGALFSFGDEDTSITERFFLGGDNFRGFGVDGVGPRDTDTDDALGGNFFFASRFQASFPIGLPEELGVFGGAFIDTGSLWALDTTTFGDTEIDDDFALRMTVGGLLFVDTPFGPVELSAGVPILEEDDDETEFFRFAIGTRF
ncbi:MAG: outer membrane protein assembly factor BamA [Pseudomonadota bacterium]